MISAKVNGIPELKAALAGLVPKLRRQALRNALAAGARIVRDDARRRAPVLQPTLKAPYRKPGTVRDAVSVRTSKVARRAGDVGVFVNVRPARQGQRGAKNPNDPFYWRWLEFGWNPAGKDTGGARGIQSKRWRRFLNKTFAGKKRPGIAFLRGAASRLPDALRVFIEKIGPQIDKMNKKGGTL